MRYLLISALFAILISCNSSNRIKETNTTDSQPAEVAIADAPLSNTYWKLTELDGKPVITDSSYLKEPHMILQTSDSTVRGHGGCNGFGGHFEWGEPNKIKFSKLISTMMACEKLEIESLFFKSLENVDNYRIVGDTLILNEEEMAPLAKFQAVYLK